jgi:hypothetical protein
MKLSTCYLGQNWDSTFWGRLKSWLKYVIDFMKQMGIIILPCFIDQVIVSFFFPCLGAAGVFTLLVSKTIDVSKRHTFWEILLQSTTSG